MSKRRPGRPSRAEPHLNLAERHDAILARVSELNFVDIGQLVKLLDVTPQTIRRDLRILEKSGRLARHHGGITASESSTNNISYTDRQAIRHVEKQRIAQAVAKIIPDGASLFINVGTTTEAVAEALFRHQRLHVITNNLNVATRLISRRGTEVTVAGGLVRNSDGAIIGEDAADFVNRFRVDYGVIGISAIDPVDGSLLDFDAREVRVAQAIMRNSKNVVLVADHSKFGRDAMIRLGSLGGVEIFCTDRPPPEPIVALLAERGVKLVIASALETDHR